MRDLSKCKKFVAVYSKRSFDEYVGMKIRIADVEQWNKFHKIPINRDYHWEIYNQIEELGLYSNLSDNSFFTGDTSKRLTLDDFKKIFAPLPWIKVVDISEKYVDSNSISEFVKKQQDSLEMVKTYKEIVIDPCFDFLSNHEKTTNDEVKKVRFKVQKAFNDFILDEIGRDSFEIFPQSLTKHCKEKIEEKLAEGKLLFALPFSENTVELIYLKDREQLDRLLNLPEYQTLKDIVSDLKNKRLPTDEEITEREEEGDEELYGNVEENKEKCKQFVAILDNDSKNAFYITDVDYWNATNGIFDEEEYNRTVYETIYSLNCFNTRTNHFTAAKTIKDKEQLEKFLSPLPWIKVIDWTTKKVKKNYPSLDLSESEVDDENGL